jgi:methylated-DNA-[protein]-cysteine S-methyltransferase
MRKFIKTTYFKSPFGDMILGSFEDELCLCDWQYRKLRPAIDNRIITGLDADFIEEGSNVVEETIKQLTQYFKGNRTTFDIPIKMIGSTFQNSVWNTLIQIPYGQTETYSGLAKRMKNEKAVRAVASANGANAISIIVPCHRIIGSNGDLTGYAGGLKTKMKLLQLENALNKNQLRLF